MLDLIVVGGGIAAFSAALFAARRGLNVAVLAKDLGGQARFTDLIENYPGLGEIGGLELVEKVKKQAEQWNIKFFLGELAKLKPAPNSFVLTAHGMQYKTKAVILAFGKTPRDLNVPGEEQFKGKGVSYCVSCDGPLYKRKIVTVAGVGDLSLEAALSAARWAKKVLVLSKTDKLVGHPVLQKAVQKKRNIEVVPFVQILSIRGGTRLETLELLDLKTNRKKDLKTDGLFVELGYVVKSDFLRGLVDLNDSGEVMVNKQQATSLAGVFACGDCTDRPYKQAVISAGDGAAAALGAYDYLMRLEGKTGLTSDWTEIKRVK